jgi:hypothetical protein
MKCARCAAPYRAGDDAYGELCPSCADATEPTHASYCAAVRHAGEPCSCDRDGEFVAVDDEKWL